MLYGIEVETFGRKILIRRVWTRQTVVLNGRSIVFLECINSPNGECRRVLYGVTDIRKLVREFSDCMELKKVREIKNGQIRRVVLISLSVCTDNCIENSN